MLGIDALCPEEVPPWTDTFLRCPNHLLKKKKKPKTKNQPVLKINQTASPELS